MGAGGLNLTLTLTVTLQVQWALEAERTLRDCLLQFFVYLFADLDDQVGWAGLGCCWVGLGWGWDS